MPNSTQEQAQRRDIIRQLLLDAPADTQQTLVDELTARGLHAPQSSVSRDLKDLGAIKTARGYELLQPDDAGKAAFDGVAEFIRAVLPAGANLVVIRTAIGAATNDTVTAIAARSFRPVIAPSHRTALVKPSVQQPWRPVPAKFRHELFRPPSATRNPAKRQ